MRSSLTPAFHVTRHMFHRSTTHLSMITRPLHHLFHILRNRLRIRRHEFVPSQQRIAFEYAQPLLVTIRVARVGETGEDVTEEMEERL